MNILFKDIRVINPAQKLDEQVNLWIKDGIIEHCDKTMPQTESNTETVESKEFVASPGLFDMHVHFRDPGFEYKEDIKSGAESAANGGFTGVVCMPNTNPTIDNAVSIDYIKNKAKDLLIDLYPSAAITQNREGKQLTEMMELNDCGVVLFTDDGSCVSNSKVLKRAFEYALTKDLLIAQHCEDHTLSDDFSVNESKLSTKLGLKGYPNVAESSILYRDIELAEYIGNCRYHAMHLSTKESIDLVRNAKKKNLRVSCEVTPHHFTINDEVITAYNTNNKMNPPLRTQEDLDAIIEGIKDGTIDCIATDHAPHALHEKDVEFESAPCGIVGLETSLGIALTELHSKHKIDLNRIIELMSINPRKVCRLQQINIKKGEKANITIFAPNEEWVVNKDNFKSKSKNSPFEFYKLKGKPKYSINNNKVYKSVL